MIISWIHPTALLVATAAAHTEMLRLRTRVGPTPPTADDILSAATSAPSLPAAIIALSERLCLQSAGVERISHAYRDALRIQGAAGEECACPEAVYSRVIHDQRPATMANMGGAAIAFGLVWCWLTQPAAAPDEIAAIAGEHINALFLILCQQAMR